MNKIFNEILRYLSSLYPDKVGSLETRQKQLAEVLNSQEFYELMQTYRHAPINNQADVVSAFDAVRRFILSSVKRLLL